MIFLPIIVDDKVYVEESDEKTATLYNYLPNEEGLPITFTDEESAVAWVAENLKHYLTSLLLGMIIIVLLYIQN